jgi:RNA polymerase sigma-70 factor (ECF subfamily)
MLSIATMFSSGIAGIAVCPADAEVNHETALNRFLAEVERRAFRMARTALHHHDDALDVVQDAMYRFVRYYRHKPVIEWPGLFQRVLQSKIFDQHRRRQRGRRLFVWLGDVADAEDDGSAWLENLPDPDMDEPMAALLRADASERLLAALAALPLRQQQAFFLRAWEGFDTAQTATAMGCTGGSVKTHLSRAMHKLRAVLEATP